MEWIEIAKLTGGVLSLCLIIYCFRWIYRQGFEKGFIKGNDKGKQQWQAEKLKIYADIQKRASALKVAKKGAAVVE